MNRKKEMECRIISTKLNCHRKGVDHDDVDEEDDRDDPLEQVTEYKARLPWSKSRQWWQPRTTSADHPLLKHIQGAFFTVPPKKRLSIQKS